MNKNEDAAALAFLSISFGQLFAKDNDATARMMALYLFNPSIAQNQQFIANYLANEEIVKACADLQKKLLYEAWERIQKESVSKSFSELLPLGAKSPLQVTREGKELNKNILSDQILLYVMQERQMHGQIALEKLSESDQRSLNNRVEEVSRQLVINILHDPHALSITKEVLFLQGFKLIKPNQG